MSLSDCFTKGAKITAEVGLSVGLIDLSRGEDTSDDYYLETIHYKILYVYSFLIKFMLLHRKYAMRSRRHCNLARGYCTIMFNQYLRYVQHSNSIQLATRRVGVVSRE
jgi:hypothetical protein